MTMWIKEKRPENKSYLLHFIACIQLLDCWLQNGMNLANDPIFNLFCRLFITKGDTSSEFSNLHYQTDFKD